MQRRTENLGNLLISFKENEIHAYYIRQKSIFPAQEYQERPDDAILTA